VLLKNRKSVKLGFKVSAKVKNWLLWFCL